jgi:hypothetical protein
MGIHKAASDRLIPIRLFCGYDSREAIGFHVFVNSVIEHATRPVQLFPLSSMGLGRGSNAFTLSRFLVAYLCGFRGHAIFCDASDMLAVADVAELDALFDARFAVQVVKHQYRTRNPRKYVGTRMESSNYDYARKNWASVMIVNCGHPSWELLPSDIYGHQPLEFLQLGFIRDEDIGELPPTWNALVDEGQPVDGAKILHWTAGIPAFDHYSDAPGADLWRGARVQMETVS